MENIKLNLSQILIINKKIFWKL